ncbi:MAG: uncharacterized protein QOF71_1977 [Candidatus Eremiobacteraeota bacterium]|jgi:hypothetical protein|nr:uncharacterized protein [Candidatus Eremiobacteraeota bacterium]
MTAALCVLIALALMGGFDTIVFHELVAKLPDNPAAQRELRLHASRDCVYVVLFGSLAWLEPHGWLVLLLAALLATEIAITLSDFIVEDRTRRLPPGERAMHAIMGITYGVFAALLFPHAVRWLGMPTGFEHAYYGWLTWLLTAFAIGVGLSGIRDVVASSALARRGGTEPA